MKVISKIINIYGESTIYLENGNIHYEGTFLNGFKYGYGKEYCCDNNLLYDGDWINNMKTFIW